MQQWCSVSTGYFWMYNYRTTGDLWRSALPCSWSVLCWLLPTRFAYQYTGCSHGQGLVLLPRNICFISWISPCEELLSQRGGTGGLQHRIAPCKLLHISFKVLQLCFEFSSLFYVSFSMGNVYGIGYQWKIYLHFELFCCYPPGDTRAAPQAVLSVAQPQSKGSFGGAPPTPPTLH